MRGKRTNSSADAVLDELSAMLRDYEGPGHVRRRPRLARGRPRRGSPRERLLVERGGRLRIGIKRRSLRRGLVVAIAVIIAALASTLALSAEYDWWFFFDGQPAATSPVVVAAQGTWDGHDWTLTAYQIKNGASVCYALTAGTDPAGRGIAMGCGPTAYPAVSPGTSSVRSTSYVISQNTPNFPSSIFGLVNDQVTRVRVMIAGADSVEIHTFSAPSALGKRLHLFALALPCGKVPTEVIGFDSQNIITARSEITNDLAGEPPPNTCQ
jgi:hypothetical protein